MKVFLIKNLIYFVSENRSALRRKSSLILTPEDEPIDLNVSTYSTISSMSSDANEKCKIRKFSPPRFILYVI